MSKKDKKDELITLEEIEALDDSDKSPVDNYDDSFIEDVNPPLTDEEKLSNGNIVDAEVSDDSFIPSPEGIEALEKLIESEEDEPEWADFDDASIKASIDAGEILPELKPRKNAIYNAILQSLPKEVKSDKGDFYTVEIKIDGMRKSLKANRSFNFCLKRYKVKNHLKYSDLVGREIVFQKDDSGYMIVQFK